MNDHSVEIMWIVLQRDISQVRRMIEITLPKTINMISIDDHHKLVLVFMPHWFDINFNVLYTILKSFEG